MLNSAWSSSSTDWTYNRYNKVALGSGSDLFSQISKLEYTSVITQRLTAEHSKYIRARTCTLYISGLLHTQRRQNRLYKIKNAFITAFVDDYFESLPMILMIETASVYDSVHVDLAHLRRLVTAFAGVPDRVLDCAFVARLPKTLRQTLRASSRMDVMGVNGILQRTILTRSDGKCTACLWSCSGALTFTPEDLR